MNSSQLMPAFDNAVHSSNTLYEFFKKNPNFRVPSTNRALFNAIADGRQHVAHLLIKRYDGLDHIFPGQEAISAMHMAVKKGYNRILRRLIQYKANQGIQNSNGYTPLNYACSLASSSDELNDNLVDCIEVLLGTCKYVNVPSKDGFMPLHFVAKSKNFSADLGEIFFNRCGKDLNLEARVDMLSGELQNLTEIATQAQNSEFLQMLEDSKSPKVGMPILSYGEKNFYWNLGIGLSSLALVVLIVIGLVYYGIFKKRGKDALPNPISSA